MAIMKFKRQKTTYKTTKPTPLMYGVFAKSPFLAVTYILKNRGPNQDPYI